MIFRVFVSSTFSDFVAERNELQERIFPRLQDYCVRRGARFQAIDLRWGVSEDAALDQQTMNICLQELARCQHLSPRPNFIVFLGDRYGWRPLPPQVPADEFELLLEQVDPSGRGLLRWEERQPVDQQGWYRRDDNAVPPQYVLRPRHVELQDAWTDERKGTAQAAFEHAPELEREVEAHREFGRRRGEHFVGRQDLFGAVRAYLDGDSDHPLVLHGVSGSGKSALLARVAEQVEAGGQGLLLARFIGATPPSADLRSLLGSLCCQLAQAHGDDRPVPDGPRELAEDLPKRLALARAERPVVVVLDALDQLGAADGARALGWLPRRLPPHVRLVVSVLDAEGTEDDCGRAARGLVPEQNQVRVGPLPAPQGEALLDAWLGQARRQLQPAQRQEVLSRFAVNGLPLYLRLAFEEARHWASYDVAPPLSADVSGLLTDLLARLEDERNHGRVLTARALGYLAAARHGLAEEESLALLSDREVLADFRRRSPRSPEVERLPAVVWSRLRADLEPYLTERRADGTAVLSFYHVQLGEAVAQRYLGGADVRARRALAAYFLGQPHEFTGPDGAPGAPNHRKCSELPWLLEQTSQWETPAALLSDHRFFSIIDYLNKYDFYRYWTRLEAEGRFRCAEAYRGLLESPEAHDEALVWDLANLFQQRGDVQAAARLHAHQVRRYERGESAEDRAKLAVVLCAQARDDEARGDFDTALARLERAERIARERSLAGPLSLALGGRGLVLVSLERWEEALAFFQAQEAICRPHDVLREHLMTCAGNQATVLAELGYLHEAHRKLAEQAELAAVLDLPPDQAHARLAQARLAIDANRFDDSLTLAGKALEIAEEYGLQPLIAGVEDVIGGIAYHPARPGAGLDLNAPNALDWFAADEGAMRAVLGAVNAVNLRDRYRRTPLMGAVYHGYFKLMHDLLKRKAGVNLRDRDNDTALAIARRRHPNQRQIAEVLLSVGATEAPGAGVGGGNVSRAARSGTPVIPAAS